MLIKRFSELDKDTLDKIINKHFNHWSQYSSKMQIDLTREKFLGYASDDVIPFGIAMFDKDNLIGFLVFKETCLEKYPQYTPWISDVMIFDEYRGLGYGRMLISEAKVVLKDMGFNKAYLWTDKAPGFYKKIGFKYEHIVEKNEGGEGELFSIDLK